MAIALNIRAAYMDTGSSEPAFNTPYQARPVDKAKTVKYTDVFYDHRDAGSFSHCRLTSYLYVPHKWVTQKKKRGLHPAFKKNTL